MAAMRTRWLSFLIVGGLAACSDGAAPPERPSVVLITLDTTRQDALSCYGGPRGLTPNLDRFAAQGVTYLEARAVAPITLPSHASMLTGLWPPRHGIRVNGVDPLPDAATTLAEAARAAGYETAAFLAAVVLGRTFGLDQGFDRYDEVERPEVKTSNQFERRNARQVVDAAIGWLDRRASDRPFLCWLHFFDPHEPCNPPAPHLMRAGGQPYYGEVAYMDEHVGRFLDELDRRGLADTTLVLVVGDHGESLGQHGERTHGMLAYDAVIKVPFLVRYPDGRRAGERSHENVSVADVYPTVAEVLDLPVGDVDGRSLVQPVPAERGVWVESLYGWAYYGWSPLVGWVQGGRKYLHSSAPELYVLDADPQEQRNRWNGAAEAGVDEHLAALRDVLAKPALPPAERPPLDPELIAEMAALGYVVGATPGGAPDPLAPSGRPSPSDSTAELALIQQAFLAAQTGDSNAAARAWGRVLEHNPDNPTAHGERAYHLLQLKRYAEAADGFRRANATGPARTMNWMNLGVCIESLGDRKGALPCYERALELDPDNKIAQQNFVRAMRLEGRAGETAAALARLGVR